MMSRYDMEHSGRTEISTMGQHSDARACDHWSRMIPEHDNTQL